LFEKRKHKRRNLLYYLSVNEKSTGKTIGRLVDITTDGLKLISEKSIKDTKDFKLLLILPELIDNKSEIYFEAKSIKCERNGLSDFYLTGFKFLDIGEEELHIVSKLINEFEFPE